MCREPSENFPVYSFKKERKKENNALGYKNHSDLMDSLTGFSEIPRNTLWEPLALDVRCINSGARLPRFEAHFCHLLGVLFNLAVPSFSSCETAVPGPGSHRDSGSFLQDRKLRVVQVFSLRPVSFMANRRSDHRQ